jgi:hypothetical protein
MNSLKPNSKSMRALRALEGTGPANPRTEYDVSVLARQTDSLWHAALKALVDRGLAERGPVKRLGWPDVCGWYITDAGREALAKLPTHVKDR